MFDATESMLAFIQTLAADGSWIGVILIVLYAMVIPAAKLVLLALVGAWRRGTPRQVMRARLCVHVLQAISKWAAPDMFAYVLLLFLLRSLDHPPLLVAFAKLDIGSQRTTGHAAILYLNVFVLTIPESQFRTTNINSRIQDL